MTWEIAVPHHRHARHYQPNEPGQSDHRPVEARQHERGEQSTRTTHQGGLLIREHDPTVGRCAPDDLVRRHPGGVTGRQSYLSTP